MDIDGAWARNRGLWRLEAGEKIVFLTTFFERAVPGEEQPVSIVKYRSRANRGDEKQACPVVEMT